MLTRENILEIRRATTDALNASKTQVAKLESKQEVLDEFLKKLPESDGQVSGNGQFAKLRLAQAVLTVIEQANHPQGLDIKEISSDLLGGGFRTKTKNFEVAVFGACTRLRKEAKIDATKKLGRRSFRARPQIIEQKS